jgi:hypothetical protein
MKYTKLFEDFINEKRNKEYTVKDLHKMILNGETITVSSDGGHSGSTYALELDYGVNPIENFKSSVLNNTRFKNKKFVQKKPGMFIVKGTEGTIDAISRFYDTDKRFKGD